MSDNNRHLRGDTNEILAPVMAKTVVEAGDLMILNTNKNVGEPISTISTASAGTGREEVIYSNFIGVAMEASLSGTTENISVATTGVFRYPLIADSAVTIGSRISAVSAPGVAVSSTTAQQVVNHATVTGAGTTAYLGYIVKTQSATSFVDFAIMTKIGDGQIAQ